MEIVIKIPDKKYEALKMLETATIGLRLGVVEKAIINGTPLPKGHGRLIDAEALNERMKQRHYEKADEESYWVADIVATALNPNNGYAPTIIEADKEVEE